MTTSRIGWMQTGWTLLFAHSLLCSTSNNHIWTSSSSVGGVAVQAFAFPTPTRPSTLLVRSTTTRSLCSNSYRRIRTPALSLSPAAAENATTPLFDNKSVGVEDYDGSQLIIIDDSDSESFFSAAEVLQQNRLNEDAEEIAFLEESAAQAQTELERMNAAHSVDATSPVVNSTVVLETFRQEDDAEKAGLPEAEAAHLVALRQQQGTGETSLHRMRRRKVAIYNKKRTMSITILFTLWYTLSMAYNVFSKKCLTLCPQLAWTQAWFQLSLGLTYVFGIWGSGYRAPPSLTRKEVQQLLPVSFLHALVHVGGVVSMGAGAVSFTYIVKASEPAVSAILSAMFTPGAFLPLPVYLTLLPVMGGVAVSSVSELSFTWKSFNYAMMSNIASSSRGIVGKKTIGKRLGKNLTPMNMYAVLTMLASAVLLPTAYFIEGPVWRSSFRTLIQSGKGMQYLVQTILAAYTYYGYNEVAFLCLDKVSPLSHAISNTVKRVFIIASSMIVFGNKMTLNGAIGSTTAVLGVLLYSLAKQHYKEKQKTTNTKNPQQRPQQA